MAFLVEVGLEIAKGLQVSMLAHDERFEMLGWLMNGTISC